jgi:hypothetical protein
MPKKKNSPHYGKGDWKRPVDEKKYSENWDRIFNKSKGDTNETGANPTPSK